MQLNPTVVQTDVLHRWAPRAFTLRRTTSSSRGCTWQRRPPATPAMASQYQTTTTMGASPPLTVEPQRLGLQAAQLVEFKPATLMESKMATLTAAARRPALTAALCQVTSACLSKHLLLPRVNLMIPGRISRDSCERQATVGQLSSVRVFCEDLAI